MTAWWEDASLNWHEIVSLAPNGVSFCVCLDQAVVSLNDTRSLYVSYLLRIGVHDVVFCVRSGCMQMHAGCVHLFLSSASISSSILSPVIEMVVIEHLNLQPRPLQAI